MAEVLLESFDGTGIIGILLLSPVHTTTTWAQAVSAAVAPQRAAGYHKIGSCHQPKRNTYKLSAEQH